MEHNNEFKRFDVVYDDSDHHFLKSRDGDDCFSNAASGVHKRIMKEWRILDQNLPESIYVRVYEKRIDLLRAAIVGAVGTPYHDGLFFFDVAFPSDYPTHPPKIYYHSYGFRLNPNLYESGKVCLSLLNTWVGKKTEKWDPTQSTLLQVLLSIQALVLNEKPFFNEPGSDHTFGRVIFKKRSQAYNETVFTINCKTMTFLLQKPPKNFESFVVRHFRRRARAIVRACNEYVNGNVRVGYYDHNGGSHSSLSTVKVSKNFKESMQVLYPRLVQWLKWAGASLGNSVEQLVWGTKGSSNEETVIDKKNKGIVNKVIVRIKKVLAFKNRVKINISACLKKKLRAS